MVAGGHLHVLPSVQVLRGCLSPGFWHKAAHPCHLYLPGVFPSFPLPFHACSLWDPILPGFPLPGADCASQAAETKGENTEMTSKNSPGFMGLAALPNTFRKLFPFHVVQRVS